MALYELSGDEIGRSKKKKRAEHLRKKLRERAKKTGTKLRIKKVKLVPKDKAKKAILSVISLNQMHMAERLYKTYKRGALDEIIKIINPYSGIGLSELKSAIAKGAKTSVSGTSIGQWEQIAIAAVPIILKLVEYFKKNKEDKLSKDKEKEDEKDMDKLKEKFDASDEFPTKNVEMPEDADVAKVKSPTGADKGKEKDDMEKESFFSPMGLCFKLILIILFSHITSPVISLFVFPVFLYSVIGFFVCIVSMFTGTDVMTLKFFSIPKQKFYSLLNKFRHGYSEKTS